MARLAREGFPINLIQTQLGHTSLASVPEGERSASLDRIDHLLEVPAAVRFLSVEPLLGPILDIPLRGIDWVIVGGESGPRSRPMERRWVLDIRDACRAAGVPFFFKQWGGPNKKRSGRRLDNRTWDEMPTPARPRESDTEPRRA